MITVMLPQRKSRGKIIPVQETNYQIDVCGDTIVLYKAGVKGTSFKVGDTATYDSFNLVYTGQITKITDKCVTIVAQYTKETHRLNLYEFCWRNHGFNAQDAAKINAETSLYI